MLKQRILLRCGLLAAAATMLTATPALAADGQSSRRLPPGECFSTRDWQGWSSPARDVLYLKVRNKEVYRVDLRGGGPSLDAPGNFLVSRVRGPSRVCSTIDLDLAVADSLGFRTHLFPTGITKLSPEEIAALPPKDRP